MTITIVIKRDNAAFEGDPDVETVRILAELIERFRYDGPHDRRLNDYNGNAVGSVRVTGK